MGNWNINNKKFKLKQQTYNWGLKSFTNITFERIEPRTKRYKIVKSRNPISSI